MSAKTDRRRYLEDFVRNTGRNVEAMIYCTDDKDELLYIASVFHEAIKNILVSVHGVDKTKEILHQKADGITVLLKE